MYRNILESYHFISYYLITWNSLLSLLIFIFTSSKTYGYIFSWFNLSFLWFLWSRLDTFSLDFSLLNRCEIWMFSLFHSNFFFFTFLLSLHLLRNLFIWGCKEKLSALIKYLLVHEGNGTKMVKWHHNRILSIARDATIINIKKKKQFYAFSKWMKL